MTIPERRATVVLIARDGSVLGRLPEFPVESPWWQEAQPVVAGARDRFGLEIVVLRLLDTELPRPQGGGVTYLAEPRGHIPSDIATRRLPPAVGGPAAGERASVEAATARIILVTSP